MVPLPSLWEALGGLWGTIFVFVCIFFACCINLLDVCERLRSKSRFEVICFDLFVDLGVDFGRIWG